MHVFSEIYHIISNFCCSCSSKRFTHLGMYYQLIYPKCWICAPLNWVILIYIIGCHHFSSKPLSKSITSSYCEMNAKKLKHSNHHSTKSIWKCGLHEADHFSASMCYQFLVLLAQQGHALRTRCKRIHLITMCAREMGASTLPEVKTLWRGSILKTGSFYSSIS